MVVSVVCKFSAVKGSGPLRKQDEDIMGVKAIVLTKDDREDEE